MLTPARHGQGSAMVHVSRVRKDLADRQRLSMWVVADNMSKGGAYNALQIYMRWQVHCNATQEIKG